MVLLSIIIIDGWSELYKHYYSGALTAHAT